MARLRPARRRRRAPRRLGWERRRVAQARPSAAASSSQTPATRTPNASYDRPDPQEQRVPPRLPLPARLACATKLEKRFPLRAPRSRPSLEAPLTSLRRRNPRGLPWAAAARWPRLSARRRPRCPAPLGARPDRDPRDPGSRGPSDP